MIKNILIVVDSIDVDDSSGSKVNVALIQNLQAIGYVVEVLHYTRKEIQLKGVVCHSIKEKKWNLKYLLSRSQRIFTRITKININPFLEGFLGFSFTFLNDVKSIEKAILIENGFQPDLVLTLSKGASFRPHYALLKIPKLHKKWMAYVHDPYPFHYYPRPYNWVEPGYQKKEDFFRAVSENAAYSAFPSVLLKEWMGSYFQNFLNTGLIIPHQNLTLGGIKKTIEIDYLDINMFNLLHAGNLMSKRDPRFLIQAFHVFLENNPNAKNEAKLLFLGDASYHKKYLEGMISENIYWSKGNIPFLEVDIVQKKVSVNIILESKSEISPFLPGKFPHCIAANKPILLIGPYYSESKRLLGSDYPFISEIDDVEKIYTHINTLYKNWKNQKNQTLNRKDLDEYLSKEYLSEIMGDIMHE